MANNWDKASDRKKAGQEGNAVKDSKGSGGYSYPIKTKKDAQDAAALLKMHKHKYSAQKVAKLRSHIRRHAKRVGATVNLASDDEATDFGNNKTGAGQQQKKAQAGKTRSQPRAFGGRFGKKGKTSGEQAMPGANQEPPEPQPEQFIATANNLQIGQSFALPDNSSKVKRLGSGYQIYKMDGSLNKVVKSLPEVHDFIKSQVKGGKNDSNQPAA